MATFKAASVLKTPITCAQAGQIVAATGTYEVPETLADNDIVALCHLPAEHEPVDFFIQADDLDTNGSPALVFDVGVLNADMDDLVASTNFITGSTVGQAGGIARADVVLGLQLAASSADRVIGVKVTTVAGTPAAGTLKGVLMYKPK
jgi:hypothetical protein